MHKTPHATHVDRLRPTITRSWFAWSSAAGPRIIQMGTSPAVLEAAAAVLSNFTTSLVTHPIGIAKLRLQASENASAESTSLMIELWKLVRGGVGEMYRGLGIELVKESVNAFIFFYLRRSITEWVARRNAVDSVSPWTRSICIGVASAAIDQLVWQSPATVVVTKVVTSRGPAASRMGTMATLRDCVANGRLYDGIEASLWLTLMPALTNTTLEGLKDWWLRRGGIQVERRRVSSLTSFWLAAIAKAFCTVVLYPLIRAKVLLQRSGGKKERRLLGSEVAGVLVRIAEEEGVPGVYRGWYAQVVKGTFASALKFALKDHIANQFGL